MTKLGLWVDDLFHNISRWKGNDFWALWSNILHVCQQECKQAGCCLDRGGEEGLYWAASHRTNPQTRKADAWLTASIDSQPESIHFFAVACFFLCTSFLCHSTTFIFHVFQCKPSFFYWKKLQSLLPLVIRTEHAILSAMVSLSSFYLHFSFRLSGISSIKDMSSAQVASNWTRGNFNCFLYRSKEKEAAEIYGKNALQRLERLSSQHSEAAGVSWSLVSALHSVSKSHLHCC